MNKTKIQWCDYTSNPIRPEISLAGGPWRRKGWFCTKISSGCANCYAERMNRRCAESGAGIGNGLAFTVANESRVRFVLDMDEIQSILRTHRHPHPTSQGSAVTSRACHDEAASAPSRRVFVGDMTDLFHPLLAFALLDVLWAAMALRPDLTFMLLTKRPATMLTYLHTRTPRDENRLSVERMPQWYQVITAWLDGGDTGFLGKQWNACHATAEGIDVTLPLPNVQIGTTAENQAAANERVPKLLRCPATARFVSYEPALGPVDFAPWLGPVHADDIDAPYRRVAVPAFRMGDTTFPPSAETPWHDGLDGIIAGGESGPNARPSHPDWFRRVRDDCAKARVPFFFKQWGEWAPNEQGPCQCHSSRDDDQYILGADGELIWDDTARRGKWSHRTAGYPEPQHRNNGAAAIVVHVGKASAGRMLDGQTHDALPACSGRRAEPCR
jgi:protein gp37